MAGPIRARLRSRAFIAVLLAAAVALGAGAPPASAAGERERKAAVAAAKAKAAAQIDVLKADDARIQDAIDVLDRRAGDLAGRLAGAKRDEQSADAAARSAEASASAASEALRTSREALRKQAIASYASGDAPTQTNIADPTAAAVAAAGVYADVARGRSTDALDRVRAAQVDADRAKAAARKASDKATVRRAATAAALAEVTTARDQQAALADRVEAKVADAQGSFDALAAEDAQLNAAIARQDAEAAARRRAELLRQQEERLKAAPKAPAGGGPIPVSGSVGGLTTVRGITVASSLAPQLAQLLAASDGAGLRLSGGGYRSSSQQVALRRAHCGSSDYDVYQKPASQCSPPTARPGASMHERGLAIDFTNNGSLLSRSNPAYGWLKANAARFGLYNLPSEAWHWSVNGN